MSFFFIGKTQQMSYFIDKLNELPLIKKEPEKFILLDAFIIDITDELVRIVSGHLCIDLAIEDVIEIRPLKLPEEFTQSASIPARLFLRKGVKLQGISPSTPYADLLCKGKIPFAISSRSGKDQVRVQGSRFYEKEKSFLRLRDIKTDKN